MPHVSRRAATLVCVVGVIIAAPAVSAQARVPTRGPALPLPPAGEPSPDTGRMRPAHVEWARYDSPAMCLAASRNVQHLTDRWELGALVGGDRSDGILGDTLAYTPALDTLSVAARTAARACLARFAVNQIPTRELTSFMQAALRVGDDARALAVVDRQLALAASAGPRAQAEVLRAAIASLFDAHPPRAATAETLLARLDALGAPARLSRLWTHFWVLTYNMYEASNMDATRREFDVIRTLKRELTPADYAEGITRMQVPQADLKILSDMLNSGDPRAVAPQVNEGLAELERANTDPGLLAVARNVVQAVMQAFVAPLGKAVPAVQVHYLFTPGTSAPPVGAAVPAPTEVRVRPGRVTFWLVAPENWRENLPAIRQFAVGVRQLRARYGDSVDIVVFTKTAGYTPGSLVQPPAEEVASIRKYFLEFRRVPATLAVSVAPMTTLPDGNRQFGPVPADRVFAGGPLPTLFVVAGRDGTFARVFQDLRPSTTLYRALDQVVGAHGAEATR